jgi:hypothetical protein
MALIGNLVVSWSNNETLLIYILMLLLDTDQSSAAIVFASLNTTRARLDLIRATIEDQKGRETRPGIIQIDRAIQPFHSPAERIQSLHVCHR